MFTFPVHPRVALQADYQPLLLNTFDEKITLLAATGVDACMLVDFTPDLSTVSARDFIMHVLSEQWHIDTLLAGYDHRFGHRRADGFEQYVEYGRACDMTVIRADACTSDEKTVSSSFIRRLLSDGHVAEAAQLLTYPYRLKGRVVYGHRKGIEMGFPTANIAVDDPQKIRPAAGVYAVRAYVGGKPYKGMLSIGNRPTFDGQETTIEVHLLHFAETIYGETIEVAFVRRLRENKKFDSPDALSIQLAEDYRTTDILLS